MNSSLLSRYPALARASRLLDGPPPCAPRSYDLFTLGVACSRLHRLAVARQGQTHTPMLPPDAYRLSDYDAKDRRGVSGD